MDMAAAAEALAATCVANGIRVAGAESCTGGMVAAELTALRGASAYFLGAVVTYSDSSKTRLLEVPPELLAELGAVSEACVLAMAKGTAERFCSEASYAISGIAGPDGGSEDKPVGLVCFGFSCHGQLCSGSRIFSGSRQAIRRAASLYALTELRSIIEGRIQRMKEEGQLDR